MNDFGGKFFTYPFPSVALAVVVIFVFDSGSFSAVLADGPEPSKSSSVDHASELVGFAARSPSSIDMENVAFKAVQMVAKTGREIRTCRLHLILAGRDDDELEGVALRMMTDPGVLGGRAAHLHSLDKDSSSAELAEVFVMASGNLQETPYGNKTATSSDSGDLSDKTCRTNVFFTDDGKQLEDYFSRESVSGSHDYNIVLSPDRRVIPHDIVWKTLNLVVLRLKQGFVRGKPRTRVKPVAFDPVTHEPVEAPALDEEELDELAHFLLDDNLGNGEGVDSPSESRHCVPDGVSNTSASPAASRKHGSELANVTDVRCPNASKPTRRIVPTGFDDILTRPTGFFIDRNDLNGAALKVAYIPASSHVTGVEHLELGSKIPPTAAGQCECGFEFAMLKAASEKLNFTFTLLRPNDGSWGSYNEENQTWEGMIGLVATGVADIAISANVRIGGATSVVDYSNVFRQSSSTFLTVKPGTVSAWQWVLTPFSWPVWIMLAASFFIASFIFYEIDKMFFLSKNPRTRKPDPQLAFMCHIGSLELDRITDRPGSWSDFPRMWFSWWQLAMQALALSYSSLLIVFLAFPPVRPPLDSLESLGSSDYFVLIRLGSAHYTLFQSAQNLASRKILDKLGAQPRAVTFVSSVKDGIYRVLTEDRTAFIFDQSQLQAAVDAMLTPVQKERVHVATNRFFEDYYLWPLRKDASWKRHIDDLISQTVESGLVRYWLSPAYQHLQLHRTPTRRATHALSAGQPALGEGIDLKEDPDSALDPKEKHDQPTAGFAAVTTPGPASSFSTSVTVNKRDESEEVNGGNDMDDDNDMAADGGLAGTRATTDNERAALKLAHFQGAFVLLALGYVMAFVALGDELCVSARQRDEVKKLRRLEKMKAMAEKRQHHQTKHHRGPDPGI